LSCSLSLGASKSGGVTNSKTPVVESMLNAAASGPPTIAYSVAGPSGSVAVTVVTAVVFSAMSMKVRLAPPFDVI
jgi:hypothetical protein